VQHYHVTQCERSWNERTSSRYKKKFTYSEKNIHLIFFKDIDVGKWNNCNLILTGPIIVACQWNTETETNEHDLLIKTGETGVMIVMKVVKRLC